MLIQKQKLLLMLAPAFWLSAFLLLVPNYHLNAKESLSKTITYHQQVKGFLALPKKAGKSKKKWPAIILIHEWWGLNADIKNKATLFSQNGYVALAVDLYNGHSTQDRTQARTLATKVRNNQKEAFANLQSAIDYLKTLSYVHPEKLASVGWCFGGGWSYQMAKNNLQVKASIIYYGFFNPADDLSKMRASILGHFAEKDRSITLDNVKAFQVKLKSLSSDHAIFIYPNTSHGFANPLNNPIYDEKSAKQAWQRTIAFLNQYLQ